jgi:eukaryotic-like serine/threonine-protein kinase
MRRTSANPHGAGSDPPTPLASTPPAELRDPSVTPNGLLMRSAPDPSSSSYAYAAGNIIARKYRLTRIIGQGGMGAVWCAHNIPLDIDVAIKLIRRDRTPPEAAGRLLQEARAAARLKHPSIVRIFDFGESELGDPFIAMELLQGEPLSAVLRRKRRLPPTIAVQTLLPVASALASAHSKGIVHRDLKPDNIFLVNDEAGALVPKIVDFGIAKLMSSEIDRQVTQAGEVLGSPDYMSPEQARGAENVGEATDIWTFTVLLYETITGRRPFDGPNYNSLIAAILTLDPTPIAESGIHEPALWSILQRGLAKRVEQRWPTMRDLGAQLAAWVVERGIEDDVAGNPISKQWFGASGKRLLTVHPDKQEGPRPSGPGAAMLTPSGSGAPAITGSGGSGPMMAMATPDELPLASSQPIYSALSIAPSSAPPSWQPVPERSRLSLWLIFGGAFVALSAAGYLAYDLFVGRMAAPIPGRAAPVAASSVELDVSDPEPESSVAEATTPASGTAPSNGKWLPRAPPRKVKAPPVPKSIPF